VRYDRDQDNGNEYFSERKRRACKNAEVLFACLQNAFVRRIYAFLLRRSVKDDVRKEAEQEGEEHAERTVKYPIFRADKYIVYVYYELKVKDSKRQTECQHAHVEADDQESFFDNVSARCGKLAAFLLGVIY